MSCVAGELAVKDLEFDVGVQAGFISREGGGILEVGSSFSFVVELGEDEVLPMLISKNESRKFMFAGKADGFDLERQGGDSPVSSTHVGRVQAALAVSCAFVVDEVGDLGETVDEFESTVDVTF